MNGYEQILVVFLSTFLAIFLALAIALTIKMIALVKSAQRITDKVEVLVEKAENVGEFLEQATAQLAVGRLIATLGGLISRKQSKKGE